jgi:hypothetical protein
MPRVTIKTKALKKEEKKLLTGPNVILTLKIAVIAVTVILLASLWALWRGNYRLHGRINLVFLVLTLAAVFGLELLVRLYDPGLFDYFDADTRQALTVHLWFSVPSAMLLPVMYVTGRWHKRRLHIGLAYVFSALWTGTFVTGVFWLPHQ